MAKLSEELKTEIVIRLARYGRYSDIARVISSEYGVSVSRFQVRSYDPTKPSFAGSDKWRAIFYAERKRFCEEVQDVPISHQAFRLNQLQLVLDRAKQSGNLALVLKTLEQAAKEIGGKWASNRSIRIDDSRDNSYKDMTPKERRDLVTDMLKNALTKH